MPFGIVLGDNFAEHGFEFRHAMGEFFERLAFGVGQFAVFQHAVLIPQADDAARHADHGRVIGHGMDYHRAGPNAHVIADADIAQYFRSRAHNHMIAERGVALAGFIAGAAEGHTLVEEHVIADLGRFSDDYAHAVIDEKAAADG